MKSAYPKTLVGGAYINNPFRNSDTFTASTFLLLMPEFLIYFNEMRPLVVLWRDPPDEIFIFSKLTRYNLLPDELIKKNKL